MRSSLQSPLDYSPILQISWKSSNPRFYPSKFPSPPLQTLSASLKVSFDDDLQEISQRGGKALVPFPIVIHRGGRRSRYLWDRDADEIRLEPFDRDDCSERFDLGREFHRLVWISRRAARNLFVPQQVPENYGGYVKWKLVHRVFSSALQVLATQAMFRAIGVGSSRSLPSAAALNWVLKDGLGRLSRCIFTASLASAFDTNLKRVRFLTSILFSIGIGVELLTPQFPQYFLLLATIANIVKSISLAAYLATGSAIHRSFAVVDNLGEVSAKAQIQTVCFDNLGLLLAAILNILCKNSHRCLADLPLVVYPFFAVVDLFAIYQALKHVHLHTLTKDRLEIVIDKWIESRFVPSPAEVSGEEGVSLCGKGSKLWPIRIGGNDIKNLSPSFSMLTMQLLSGEDFYFICTEAFYTGLKRKRQHGIVLCLRDGAGTKDIIMGMLQACLTRKLVLLERECLAEDSAINIMWNKWLMLVKDTKRTAHLQVNLLMEEMQSTGWAMKNILLNTDEQIRYSLVED